MIQQINPFARGYYGFEIRRVAVISYDDRHPQTFAPLHPTQHHLPDDQVALHACIFNEEYALVTENQVMPEDLDATCSGSGTILAVFHSIYGKDVEGALIHIGDGQTLESAQEVVRTLTFETGFYSRCWEISTAHISEDAGRFLCELADIATPTAFLFVAFRIPYSPAVGIKLIATPWTDANLQQVESITAEELRAEHRAKGVPAELIDLLHLAGQADVRMLVLDADASILEGLPIIEERA
ncbi:TPA: ABC transporter substrate-binding protein [Pseudomonas putida]|nr:ABC transporter substrate-binding protein [Pseudomonas putida]HDS1799930.1 ABC transporter substrate-binding protein [Pseudomonas putida]HDS1806324.1 ABC transporter substrate-binding protein [Pseudomonas putida]